VYTNPPSKYHNSSENSTHDIRDAWCEFLGRWQWEWFCTLTFKFEIHPEAADKSFRYFVSKLNRQLYGPRWHKKAYGGIPWVRGLEYQQREVIHFHALFSNVKDLRRLSCMDLWDKIVVGWARIEAIKNKRAACRYITKYVVKEGNIELGGALSKSARALLNQIPSGIPAQPALPLTTDSDAGGGYATITS